MVKPPLNEDIDMAHHEKDPDQPARDAVLDGAAGAGVGALAGTGIAVSISPPLIAAFPFVGAAIGALLAVSLLPHLSHLIRR